MRLLRLAEDYPLSAFDCGDEDLNNFLYDDAICFIDKRIANTFILEDEGRIAGYFCLLNDKISRLEITNNRWRQIRDSFPYSKRFRSYPSVKLGRLAVSKEYRHRNVGTLLITIIKKILVENASPSAYRFLTVDAYINAVNFYQKNGFHLLNQKDGNSSTRLMYFDLLEVSVEIH